MASYAEIGFDILELLKNNQISDDTDISLEHILYHVGNQRALLLRNEYNKSGRKLDSHLISDLGCFKIIEVDAAECCSVTSDCIVLRTEKQLPSFLELHSGVALTRVGPVNKMVKPFTLIDQARVPYIGANKYTANDVYVLRMNDYIYLITQNPAMQNVEYINIQGIVSDPLVLQNYMCTENGHSCFSYDNEYPINTWMLPYIKEQVLNQFGISLQLPKDNDNNAKDNISKN